MVRSLKARILFGFLLLIAMLLVAEAMTVYKYVNLNISAQDMIGNNYRSIEASQRMLEVVDEEETAVLSSINGSIHESYMQLNRADSTFYGAFTIASNNVTEPDADKYILAIKTAYAEYRNEWQKLFMTGFRRPDFDWSFYENIHRQYLLVKDAIESHMRLNHNGMYSKAAKMQNDSRQAIMPGIISNVAVLIIALVLYFFIYIFFIRPVDQLAEAVKNYSPRQGRLQFSPIAEDEIRKLAGQIQNLIDKQVVHTRAEEQASNGTK